ncbi:MAG: hypothetical protein WBO46_15895, partial [Caldilineaceae bacterium]
MADEKYKRCLNCQNFIPELASVCMYCGANQEQQPATKEKKKGKGIGRILLFGVAGIFLCIVLAIIGSFISGEQPTTNRQPQQAAAVAPATFTPAAVSQQVDTPTPIPTDTPIPTPSANPIGADVFVADVRWNVREAEDMGNELKSDNQFVSPKSTTGRFIRVRFEVENRSRDQLSFGGIPLRDATGREFVASSDAFFWIPDGENCIFETLNPNVTKNCTVIYEVASDATGLF